MDMNQLNALTHEQKEAYLEISKVFGMKGWEFISREYEQLSQQAKEAGANANTWEENRINFGLRTAYEQFANLEVATEQMFTQIAEQVMEDQAMIDESDYE